MLDVFQCRCPARRKSLDVNDEITLADCQACLYKPRAMNNDARAFILKNNLCPGDVLCMTAAVHSLHRAHPGAFITAVDTTCPALWEFNPDVVSIEKAREMQAEEVQCHYPLVNSSNQLPVHVLQGYTDFLADNLKVKVPLATNRPMVYLAAEERVWMNQVEEQTGYKGKFWLVCAGRKADYTSKFWGTENYQRLVDLLRGRVQFVQVGSAEHHHPPLRNVIHMVGKTDMRQLVRLAWHAQGGVGGVTFLQHLMAALEKPYVCIMGGREPVFWNSYPKQHLLHTIGALPCCRDGGCWKSRVVKLNDGSEQDNSLCENAVPGEEPLPKCQVLVRPEEVAEKIRLTLA